MHKMNFLFIFLSYNKISILSIPSSFFFVYHATKKVVHILIPPENYYSIMLYVTSSAGRIVEVVVVKTFRYCAHFAFLFISRINTYREGQKKDIKIFYFILFFFSLQNHKYFTTASIRIIYLFLSPFLIISHWHAKNVNGTNGE